MIFLLHDLYCLLFQWLLPTTLWRDKPPDQITLTDLAGGPKSSHEEIWSYHWSGWTIYRVRYVREPPRKVPYMSDWFNGKQGYKIDRLLGLYWQKGFDNTVYGGLQLVEEEINERIPRRIRESLCFHDYHPTTVHVGGEIVHGRKCQKCGHLDYW